MNSSLWVSAILLTIFFAMMVHEAEAQKTCKAVLSDMTKQQMSMMSKCAKGMKFKNAKDKAAKSMCIMKCVLRDAGMLNEKGSTDMETMKIMVDKLFEEEYVREHVLKNSLGPCAEKHAAAMDDTEEFCKSYDPFVKCLMGGLMTMCPPAPAS